MGVGVGVGVGVDVGVGVGVGVGLRVCRRPLSGFRVSGEGSGFED